MGGCEGGGGGKGGGGGGGDVVGHKDCIQDMVVVQGTWLRKKHRAWPCDVAVTAATGVVVYVGKCCQCGVCMHDVNGSSRTSSSSSRQAAAGVGLSPQQVTSGTVGSGMPLMNSRDAASHLSCGLRAGRLLMKRQAEGPDPAPAEQ